MTIDGSNLPFSNAKVEAVMLALVQHSKLSIFKFNFYYNAGQYNDPLTQNESKHN